jgi:hypothetical protein
MQPDLGPEASTWFQSQVSAKQAPYTRPKHRITTVDGAGFATFTTDARRSPFVGKPWQKDEATDA